MAMMERTKNILTANSVRHMQTAFIRRILSGAEPSDRKTKLHAYAELLRRRHKR